MYRVASVRPPYSSGLLPAVVVVVTGLTMLLSAPAHAQAPAPPASDVILIRNVRVFDGELMVPRSSVLVSGGRIARVAPNLTAPAGAQVIDGTGKTLLPGFIDSHTHSWGTSLRDAAVLGVTTVLDMFTEPNSATQYRKLDGTPEGRDQADFRSASVLVTAPKGHGTQFGVPIPTITSPNDAPAFVDARLAEGSDYIKIVYDDGHTYGTRFATIDSATMQAVVRAAHARNRMAIVHIGDLAGARAAIQSGANGLVHLFVDSMPDAEFARLVATRKAFVIPTLTVLEAITARKGGETLVNDGRLKPYIRSENIDGLKMTFPGRSGPPRSYEAARETVRQLHRAGVPILAGSDAPNPGTAHGASIHREMELLVDAGLTPTQALRSATSIPARAFSLADRGRIVEGLRADLVLVNGDPTTDILATRDIVTIWKRGVAIDRDGFRSEVAKSAAAAAAGTFPVPAGLEPGDISDFDSGQPAVKFGSGWFVTTDQIAGGKSVASTTVVAGGANGTSHAYEITGTLDAGLPFGWSGVMFTPGQTAMAPTNLSSKKELRFHARAEEGRSYALMIFSRSKGQMPITARFTTSTEWKEITMPFASFQGIDGRDIMGIAFVASGNPGPFKLQIDDVKLR